MKAQREFPMFTVTFHPSLASRRPEVPPAMPELYVQLFDIILLHALYNGVGFVMISKIFAGCISLRNVPI